MKEKWHKKNSNLQMYYYVDNGFGMARIYENHWDEDYPFSIEITIGGKEFYTGGFVSFSEAEKYLSKISGKLCDFAGLISRTTLQKD